MTAYDALEERGVDPLSVKWIDARHLEIHLLWGTVTEKKSTITGVDGPILITLKVDRPGPIDPDSITPPKK